MALRNLVARMRTPAAAAALRLPRVSPAVGSRPFFTARLQGKQHVRRTLDLESASTEEIVRETELLSKRADEALERVWEYNEKLIPGVLQDFYRKMKLIIGVAATTQILEWVVSSRQTIAGHSE